MRPIEVRVMRLGGVLGTELTIPFPESEPLP